MSDVDPKVFVASPHYGLVHARNMMALLSLAEQGIPVRFASSSMSLLAFNFNTLWCMALNGRKEHGFTHFCMIHADVTPFGNWLPDLLGILKEERAEIVSAAIPIKDAQGIVSAGLDMSTPDEPWKRRRLTMHELHQLPETFDCHDLADFWGVHANPLEGAPALLFNTGLWIADLRSPWVERICFTIRDRIIRDEDGRFRAQVEPEDWDFSKQVHRLGVRAVCTRKIHVHHEGGLGYTNHAPWGNCSADPCWVGEEAAQAREAESGLLVEV